MKKIILLAILIISAALLKIYVFQPPEAKINAAFPLSQEIKFLNSDIQTKITEEKEMAFTNAYENKLKLRALNCSNGYQPAWYETIEKTKLSLQNTSCFNDADYVLKQWLDIINAGLILEQAPLRSIPASPSSFIIGDGFIRSASFSRNAGVGLLRLKKQLQIVDIATNKTIFKENQNKGSYGINISPNGRLFYIANQEGVKIKKSENGALIATLAANTGGSFSWIDNRFGFYSPLPGRNPMIVDFHSGKEIKLRGIQSSVTQAFPIKSTFNSQFIITGDRFIYKFEIVTSDNNVAINLLAETVLESGNHIASNTASITKDDKYFFSAWVNTLSIISVDDFHIKTIDTSPFRMQTAIATNNPDEIIIQGYNKDNVSRQRAAHFFLYSIADNTISPITDDRTSSYRFVHTHPLNSIGVIKKSKIELLDEITHKTPVVLTEFISNLAAEASLKKLQLIEKLKASAPLAAKAKNTQIEAIGVYEGAKHKNGDVIIKVKRSIKPITLVLSSYEGVKWRIVKMPGAKIATILLSGYEQSEVIGAGATRVTNLGRVYAYKKGGAYQKLDNAVFQMAGKRIDFFQGRYKGVTFSVGGK